MPLIQFNQPAKPVAVHNPWLHRPTFWTFPWLVHCRTLWLADAQAACTSQIKRNRSAAESGCTVAAKLTTTLPH
jgi:hypothetical protein